MELHRQDGDQGGCGGEGLLFGFEVEKFVIYACELKENNSVA